MNIGFSSSRSYSFLNSKIFERVQAGENESVMAFLGVGHGLSELCISLANMFEHKRAIAVVTGVSPFFEDIAVYFSRQGYKVQKFDCSSGDSFENWIDNLDRGTLFLLNSADHPISGEVFHDSALFEKIDQKKIYQIQCSYNYHCFYPEQLSSLQHGVHLLSAAPNRAYARLGSRVKLKPVMAQGIDWSEFAEDSFVSSDRAGSEKQDQIIEFETADLAGAKPYFANSQKRLFDRAVLFWDDLDSSAVRELLKERGFFEGAQPGYDTEVESFSFCRWQEIQSFPFQLKKDGTTLDRGLMVIVQSLIGDSTQKMVSEAAQEIRSLQG